MLRQESENVVVCAGQRMSQEGSSPSGARMRGAVSKGGGNASSASGFTRRRTGGPERSGIRRVCGEVSGCNRMGETPDEQVGQFAYVARPAGFAGVQDRPPACEDADAADGDRGALSP